MRTSLHGLWCLIGPGFLMAPAAPVHASIVHLDVQAEVAYITPGSALDDPLAPFQLGDPVSIQVVYDTEAVDTNPDSDAGLYSFLSLATTWGSYTAQGGGTPVAPGQPIVGLVTHDGAGGIYGGDLFRVLDQRTADGGGLTGDPVMGLPLIYFELTLEDSMGLGLTSVAPPAMLDVADFNNRRFGQLVFGDLFAGAIVSLGNVTGSAHLIPEPGALPLAASALLGLLGMRKRRRRCR